MGRRHAFPVLVALALAGAEGRAQESESRPSMAGAFARNGAMIGALGVGLATGVLARGLCDSASCDGTFVEGFMLGVPFGAGAGAVAGALVGSTVRARGPVYSEQPRLRWGWSYGSAIDRPPTGPEPVSTLRGWLGWTLRPEVDAFVALTRTDYRVVRRVVPGSGGAAYREVDGRGSSGAVGVGYSPQWGPSVRLSTSMGLARTGETVRTTDPITFLDGAATRSSVLAFELSAALEAGWAVDIAPASNFGARAGATWLSDSPSGGHLLLQLGVSMWR